MVFNKLIQNFMFVRVRIRTVGMSVHCRYDVRVQAAKLLAERNGRTIHHPSQLLHYPIYRSLIAAYHVFSA